MKRLWKPLLCLLLAALTLSGCSGQPSATEQFPGVTQALGPATPTPEPIVPETETDPQPVLPRALPPPPPPPILQIHPPISFLRPTIKLPSRTP